MKNRFMNSKAMRTVITALALSSTFFAASAQAGTDLTPRMNVAAESLGFKLSGVADAAAGCAADSGLNFGQCQDIADEINESIHRGAWSWAPRGCHFNTKHGGIWFNDHGTGSNGNTNYTSVCTADVAITLADRVHKAAGDLDLTLRGEGSGHAGCDALHTNIDQSRCQGLANASGEALNAGSWSHAPRGCHFNTKHGGVWFNQHGTGSNGNTNYTSVCETQFVDDTLLQMTFCEFTEKERAYSSCLQLQHPNLFEGDHHRWNMRGALCTEVVRSLDAPVSYNQVFSTDASDYIQQTQCNRLGKKSYVTDLKLTRNNCPTGYRRVATRDHLNGDLNQNAGGIDIFLCEKREFTDPENAIQWIDVMQHYGPDDAGNGHSELVTGHDLNGDTNQTAGGDTIKIYQGRVGHDRGKSCSYNGCKVGALKQVFLQNTPHCPNGEKRPWTTHGRPEMNLNSGTWKSTFSRSTKIYLCGSYHENYEVVTSNRLDPMAESARRAREVQPSIDNARNAGWAAHQTCEDCIYGDCPRYGCADIDCNADGHLINGTPAARNKYGRSNSAKVACGSELSILWWIQGKSPYGTRIYNTSPWPVEGEWVDPYLITDAVCGSFAMTGRVDHNPWIKWSYEDQRCIEKSPAEKSQVWFEYRKQQWGECRTSSACVAKRRQECMSGSSALYSGDGLSLIKLMRACDEDIDDLDTQYGF